MKNLGALVLFSWTMTLAACSGGGNDPQNTPPPVDSTAPTVSFSPATVTVEASGTVSVSLSARDNVGLPSAPSVECTNDGRFSDSTFTAPFTMQNITSICTATVSDAAGNTGSAQLTVTVRPLQSSRAGQLVGIYNPALELLIGNGDVGGVFEGQGSAIFASRRASKNTSSTQLELVAIAGDATLPLDYERDDILTVEGVFESIDFVQTPSLAASGLPDASISVLSVEENKLHWHTTDSDPRRFERRETIDVESPCFVSGTNTFFGNDVIIGQVSKGLSLFDVETGSNTSVTSNFTATSVSNAGMARSLCHIIRGLIPESVENQAPPLQTVLTAIDSSMNELVFLGIPQGGNQIQELASTPLLVNATTDLEIVDVLIRGTPTQSPRYIFVLLSDRQHIGEHRLLLISVSETTFVFEQTIVHSWTEGAPIGFAQSQFGGSSEGGIFRPDLIVVLGTADQSLFFDNQRPLSDGFVFPPIYGAPQLFDLSAGAGSVVAARRPDAQTDPDEPSYGVLVSYPDTGEVRFVSPEL